MDNLFFKICKLVKIRNKLFNAVYNIMALPVR